MQIDNIDFSKIERLIDRLTESTCNFMAVKRVSAELDANGFTRLDPADRWDLKPGGKYYVIKNGSALFAFIMGKKNPADAGFNIIASHTDSPCFKLKPNCEMVTEGGLVSLNVEKYGGGIMYTWFDRPLSISGRVLVGKKGEYSFREYAIDFKRPVATIPHLAIHFNRAVNEGNPLSVQRDMIPVVGQFTKEELEDAKEYGGIIKKMIADELTAHNDLSFDPETDSIIDYELCLYPDEVASLTGAHYELLQSGRIDDLSMVFASLEAFIEASEHEVNPTRIMALFDNEETGSGTKQGGASPVLRNIMERIVATDYPADETDSYVSKRESTVNVTEDFFRALSRSFMISADGAHAWHPNYNAKYDPTNHALINHGPALKINANCKYMTDGVGAARFRLICDKAGVPVQYFVNHSDVAGGSTLGNIATSQIDIEGVDMGNPIWAMHSARETGGVLDYLYCVQAFSTFWACD